MYTWMFWPPFHKKKLIDLRKDSEISRMRTSIRTIIGTTGGVSRTLVSGLMFHYTMSFTENTQDCIF